MSEPLPIPFFAQVKQVIYASFDCLVLITPDPKAGAPHRFSVIRIFRNTGKTTCIGRELDIISARIVADRPSYQDGRPIPKQEG